MTKREPVCEGGRLLLRALDKKGLTLEEGEELCGRAAGYFSRLISGGRKMVNLQIAEGLRDLLGVPIDAWGRAPRSDARQNKKGKPRSQAPAVQPPPRNRGAGRGAAARGARAEVRA